MRSRLGGDFGGARTKQGEAGRGLMNRRPSHGRASAEQWLSAGKPRLTNSGEMILAGEQKHGFQCFCIIRMRQIIFLYDVKRLIECAYRKFVTQVKWRQAKILGSIM